jgi:diguanylate cyclase (GGDEF)-like protein
VGHDWFDGCIPEDQRESARARLLEGVTKGDVAAHAQSEILARNGERRTIAWDNALLRDADGKPAGVSCTGTDITDRLRTEARLRHGVLHDALTGLPNRSLFMDRLAGCMGRAKRRPLQRFAVLFLDIDRFKLVNDSLGHLVGDKLLIEVGQRLEKCLRPGDSVARLGGDEFAVLIEDMADGQVPALVAGRIQAVLSRPFELAGQEVSVTASIGTAENKPRYKGPGDFMRDADSAVHHAKAKGKGRHEVFATAMHTRAMVLLQIENDLRRAIEREELSLHYQPIVSLPTGEVAGFEALVRWERSVGGFVPSEDFIPIAEETGLIVPMGAWVLHRACQQVKRWQDTAASARRVTVSVNLSAKQFAQPDLVANVARTLEETALDPNTLSLEVTESILMQEPDAAAAMLTEIRAQGVFVCIDDFGTGYSSLSYLLQLPAQTIKIDRSFVAQMSDSSRHGELVRSIVGLAHNLGMKVVAEGVETEEQMRQLSAIDCDYAQGFLLSRPVDAAASERLLQEGRLPRTSR